MAQTLFPVVRRGQLVRATSKISHEPRALTLEQSSSALGQLHGNAERTLEAMQKAMCAALPGRKVVLIDDGKDQYAPAGRAPGLGVVYNYSEFAIAVDGAVVIVRASVTLCIKPPQDLMENGLPFSKFWTRFILVTHPDGDAKDQRAINLPDAALQKFDEDCTALHVAAIDAIKTIYCEVLSEAIGEPLDLDTQNNGAFEVLTIGAKGGDVPELFDAIREGGSLSQQVKDGPHAAKLLFRLAMPTVAMGSPRQIDDALERFRSSDEYQFLVYESPHADRGLYVARVEGKTARFVGMALADRETTSPDLATNFREAHHAAANVVSAGLIAQYARQF